MQVQQSLGYSSSCQHCGGRSHLPLTTTIVPVQCHGRPLEKELGLESRPRCLSTFEQIRKSDNSVRNPIIFQEPDTKMSSGIGSEKLCSHKLAGWPGCS